MDILRQGIEIRKQFVDGSILDEIKAEINASQEQYPRHGIRNADKKFLSVNKLIRSEGFISLAGSILGSSPDIVRVIYFDKTPDKNWLVSWHQDKTITLDLKEERDGWGPWTIKDGLNHVQPPIEVLNQMVTFRLHLDDSDENNGCLKVIPDSHKEGILLQEELIKLVSSQKPYLCEVEAGDLVLMRPHIIHSSSKSLKPTHRRVIHVEYSNYQLPGRLSWLSH